MRIRSTRKNRQLKHISSISIGKLMIMILFLANFMIKVKKSNTTKKDRCNRNNMEKIMTRNFQPPTSKGRDSYLIQLNHYLRLWKLLMRRNWMLKSVLKINMRFKTNMDKGTLKTTKNTKPISRVKFIITGLLKKNRKNSI